MKTITYSIEFRAYHYSTWKQFPDHKFNTIHECRHEWFKLLKNGIHDGYRMRKTVKVTEILTYINNFK